MRTTRIEIISEMSAPIWGLYIYIFRWLCTHAKKSSNAAAAVRTHARTHSTQNNVLNTNSIPSSAYRPHKYSSICCPARPPTHTHKYRDSFAFVNRNKHILNNTTNASVMSSSTEVCAFVCVCGKNLLPKQPATYMRTKFIFFSFAIVLIKWRDIWPVRRKTHVCE